MMPVSPAVRNQHSIDCRNRGRQVPSGFRDGEINFCIRESGTERIDRRHRQDQIADALELNEKNSHRAVVIASS